jgi:Transposase DDE domain
MYVDGAYISAGSIQQAKKEGWQLLGPAQPSASRAGLEPAYRIEAFDISIRERQAICPQGNPSTQCSQLVEQKSGKVTYRFEFGHQCRDCPVRSACVPSTQELIARSWWALYTRPSNNAVANSKAPNLNC